MGINVKVLKRLNILILGLRISHALRSLRMRLGNLHFLLVQHL